MEATSRTQHSLHLLDDGALPRLPSTWNRGHRPSGSRPAGYTGRQLVAKLPAVLEAELTLPTNQLHGETEAVGPGGQLSRAAVGRATVAKAT